MPALTFQKRFAAAVEAGRKRQTVRRARKRPIRPGDRLVLYTGMRTKHCRRLGKAVCRTVEPVLISANGAFVVPGEVRLSGRPLGAAELDEFIAADGFDSHLDFFDWFGRHYGQTFYGVVIRW